ncbi:MAG: hypothetical protein Q4G36_07265 [Paracoccus sp. (in: a-proteobacteria)]|nr:hypothetical protein [Paracoccus sp. (in: a-proteobacteria)]
MNWIEVKPRADEVAMLMATRLGGTRRGETVDLEMMIRRRGGALPHKLLRQAQILREAERVSHAPKIARQTDFTEAERAHADLVAYLQPFGRISRWQERATNIAASILFGLLLLGILVVWLMVRQGVL